MRSSVHDSTGPNIRVRGNAYQVMEKYLAMARDAAAAGDRIAAENYYQHAEHYFRTLNASGGNGGGDRHHPMNTPSDPTAGDDSDFDDEMSNARPAAVDQRQMAPNAGNNMRPTEQPRIDPSRVEQPRTDMPGIEVAPGAPEPFDGRGQGERDHEQRRRGPNGRRRPAMPDGHGPRPGQGGNQPGGQAAPTRDPRSISPGSPAEAASSEGEPVDPDKPSDA